MAFQQISSADIANNTISTADLADGAVTNTKISDGIITTDKFAEEANSAITGKAVAMSIVFGY
jgi:hypothetical protein